MEKKLCYTLIQFALMMAIMMGNMKTCQVSFNSFLTNWQITFWWRRLKYRGIELNFPAFCRYWKYFLLWVLLARVSNNFQVQWMKINNWKTASNKKSVMRKSHIEQLFYIFTNADNFLSNHLPGPHVWEERQRVFFFITKMPLITFTRL